jgi:hypothetical protein
MPHPTVLLLSIRCREVFTKPLPSNDKGIKTHGEQGNLMGVLLFYNKEKVG